MKLVEQIRDFCALIAQDQYLPQRKWIFDMLTGMAIQGSPLLSEIGRSLQERTRDGTARRRLIHTEKRLSRGLNADRLHDDRLRSRYLAYIEQWTRKDDGEGTVIAVDYTDLAKPYADLDNGMEGVCTCWDGSEHVTGTGYPVVQIEADTGTLQLPVTLHPFSYTTDLTHASQTLVFLQQIQQAAPHIGTRAWWTADRGFDNTVFFNGMDQQKLRWIVRLQHGVKNQRSLFLNGELLRVEDAALQALTRFKMQIPAGRKRRKHRKMVDLEIGARKVYLTDQKVPASPVGPARTMIVVWGFGKKPHVLLVGEHLETKEAILEATRAYGRRWKAEEATRAAKDSRRWGVRLEDVRALKMQGVRRIVMLAMLLYTLMATIRAGDRERMRQIMEAVNAFGDVPTDPRYRLMRGIGIMLAAYRAWLAEQRTRRGAAIAV